MICEKTYDILNIIYCHINNNICVIQSNLTKFENF